MAHPVIPPAHRGCSSPVLPRAARPRSDGIGIRTTCPYPPSGDVVVPFGRDDTARPVTWDLTSGRNLLVHQHDRESAGLLPVFLLTVKALTAHSHEVFVVDPHRTCGWLRNCTGSVSRRAHRADHRESIPALLDRLTDAPQDRRRLLVVAGLRATVDLLGPAERERFTELVASAPHRQLTVVAVSSDRDARWFPDGLVDAFDDVITRPSRKR